MPIDRSAALSRLVISDQPPASNTAPGTMTNSPMTISETCTTSVSVTAHMPPAKV